MKTITMFMVAVVILAGVLTAQSRYDTLRTGDIQAGMAGDSKTFERLMQTLEEALAANPKDAKAKVTHGIGILRRSGDAAQKGELETSARLYQSALEEMEQAVQLDPENVAIRIPRGATLISASRFMPAQMTRPILETGLADFERVLKRQQDDNTFQKLSEHKRGELLTGLADGWDRIGNKDKARAYFQRIVTELGGTIYQKRAQAWLEDKPEVKSPTFFACSGCHVE